MSRVLWINGTGEDKKGKAGSEVERRIPNHLKKPPK